VLLCIQVCPIVLPALVDATLVRMTVGQTERRLTVAPLDLRATTRAGRLR